MENNIYDNINLPKTKRGEATLDKICDAAEYLFGERGYYNTSVNDIAYRAGVAPGTIYIYFEDKKSIFQYLINNLKKNLKSKLSQATRECEENIEKEFLGQRAFFEFVNMHRGLYKIIWEAQFVDKELFKDYYSSFARGYIRRLTEASKNGEYRNINPETLAYILMGISNFIGLRWIIFEEKGVPEEVIKEIMDVLKYGILK